MSSFRTGPFAGDDEAKPLGDEHYPENDEYEDVDETAGDGADEEEA